jgi:phage FluMu protein gp41
LPKENEMKLSFIHHVRSRVSLQSVNSKDFNIAALQHQTIAIHNRVQMSEDNKRSLTSPPTMKVQLLVRSIMVVGLIVTSIAFIMLLQIASLQQATGMPFGIEAAWLPPNTKISSDIPRIVDCGEQQQDYVLQHEPMQPQPQQRKPPALRYDSSDATVMAMAQGYDLFVHQMYVGSLRKTGYNGTM